MLLLAALSVPAQAAVSLRWAPALDTALGELSGPGLAVAKGFDGEALKGLQVRINEVHALSRARVEDLDGLRRFRRQPDAAVMPAGRLAALERSLRLFKPVIARLEAQGIKIDDMGRASKALGPALSRALAAEALETDRRALALASRYGVDEPLEPALAASEEADALLRDRYLYLSFDATSRLAAVYDSGRTQMLAARLAERGAQVAIVSAQERGTMRDAVSAGAPATLYQRFLTYARDIAGRLRNL